MDVERHWHENRLQIAWDGRKALVHGYGRLINGLNRQFRNELLSYLIYLTRTNNQARGVRRDTREGDAALFDISPVGWDAINSFWFDLIGEGSGKGIAGFKGVNIQGQKVPLYHYVNHAFRCRFKGDYRKSMKDAARFIGLVDHNFDGNTGVLTLDHAAKNTGTSDMERLEVSRWYNVDGRLVVELNRLNRWFAKDAPLIATVMTATGSDKAAQISRVLASGVLHETANPKAHPVYIAPKKVKAIIAGWRMAQRAVIEQFIRDHHGRAAELARLKGREYRVVNLDDPEVMDREVARIMGNTQRKKNPKGWTSAKWTDEHKLGWTAYKIKGRRGDADYDDGGVEALAARMQACRESSNFS